MKTGERLRLQREKSGLTLGQVGEYEGITAQYLSDLERGRNSPNVWSLIMRLAKRYRCSADYLLGLTDDPSPAGESSEIQDLYNRLSAGRQADLLQMAETWLIDESDDYLAVWMERFLAKYGDDPEAMEKVGEIMDELLGERDEANDVPVE